MKKSSPELKSIAKGALTGRYGIVIGTYMLYSFIAFLILFFMQMLFPANDPLTIVLRWISNAIVSLLLGVLGVGLNRLVLNISRNQPYEFSDLFYGFSNRPDRIIGITLLLYLINSVCEIPYYIASYLLPNSAGPEFASLLLLILSVSSFIYFLITLQFALVNYIYLDDPDKGVMEIMRESQELMKGNKGRFFYLSISFTGMLLLSILTCFIGFLWLMPYMEMTMASFYRNIVGEI